jgi:hypothetical protein
MSYSSFVFPFLSSLIHSGIGSERALVNEGKAVYLVF